MSVCGHQEAVVLYGSDEDICAEMSYADFELLLSGKSRLDAFAASLVKAVYCVIGDGLSLRGVAFFVFKVDEEGILDPAFNLPLPYLVQNAAAVKDMGQGPVRKASRAQCPVPWHAVNLWEPQAEDALETLQGRIYRNKLKLISSTGCGDDDFFAADHDALELFDCEPSGEDSPFTIEETHPSSRNGQIPVPTPLRVQDRTAEAAQNLALTDRLNEVFGVSGKISMQDIVRLHTEQLNQIQARHRADMDTEQTTHREQLRACRQEIHDLKVALRQEQGRSRRLQQMLRGDL